MTRAEFTTEFNRSTRFVIQKQDRVNAVVRALAEHGSTPARERAYEVAQTNLDAAIDQAGDHHYDLFEAMVARAVAQILTRFASVAGGAS